MESVKEVKESPEGKLENSDFNRGQKRRKF